MINEIIGKNAGEDNPKTEKAGDFRPGSCPTCLTPARYNGHLVLVGHGTYKRWAKIPQEIRIRIHRFRCRNCGKTCSVLPHWLLPRYQYNAVVILESLYAFYVDGATAAAVTKKFSLSAPKHGWGTLHRWAAAFLVSASLWGWLGSQLGARNGAAPTRQRVRSYLRRFMTHFSYRVDPAARPDLHAIMRRSLAGMGFSHGTAWPLLHARREEKSRKIPRRSRSGPSTHHAGPSRAPPGSIPSSATRHSRKEVAHGSKTA